jgi:hypothetical protein
MDKIKKFNEEWESGRIDTLFIQEISDRLFGPDSECYMKAIKELNVKFRPREGRKANQFYDPSISGERRRKEDEINRNILKGE